MPNLSAHSCALCKNEARKYRNETGIHVVSVLYYDVTARLTQFVTQTIHYTLC